MKKILSLLLIAAALPLTASEYLQTIQQAESYIKKQYSGLAQSEAMRELSDIVKNGEITAEVKTAQIKKEFAEAYKKNDKTFENEIKKWQEQFYVMATDLKEEAKKKFDRVADMAQQGKIEAQYQLGNAYANGWGVSQDNAEAAKWFSKAANANYAPAQYSLALMYQNGLGLEKNDGFAVDWLKKAAAQHYFMAQNALGDAYYYGQGVKQDYAEAVKYYQSAAGNFDYPAANANLGFCYNYGKGVPQDLHKAYEYYRKAAAMGNELAQKLAQQLEQSFSEQ